MRVGYLTEEQFVETISGTVKENLNGTYQPLDATLTDLAARNIGAAAATDILDRQAGDGRYALVASGYSDEQAQDAVGTILTDTATVDFTYNDATPSITADVIDGSLGNVKLASMAQATIKGRAAASGTGAPIDLTPTQAKTLLAIAASDVSGLATIATSGSASDLSAGTVAAARMPALTGDITTSAGTVATMLATVNSNTGTWGSATQVPQITLDGKGRATAASNVTITPAASSITGGAAITRTNDTNVTVTLGGSPTTAVLSATSFTLGWTGTLAVSRGGLGVGTITGLLQGNGTSAVTAITDSSTTGQVLRVTGANTYAWGALSLSTAAAITGTLPVGNGGTGITAFGTGVATALGVNVGAAGAFVTFNGALGTPSSGTLTNCTGLLASNVISTATGDIAATNVDAAIAELEDEKEPNGRASNRKSVNYTLVLSDKKKVIIVDSAAAQMTVPPVASVAWPTGTVLKFINNDFSATTLKRGAGVSFYLAGGGNADRTLASFGVCYLHYTGSDVWMASGTGVT